MTVRNTEVERNKPQFSFFQGHVRHDVVERYLTRHDALASESYVRIHRPQAIQIVRLRRKDFLCRGALSGSAPDPAVAALRPPWVGHLRKPTKSL